MTKVGRGNQVEQGNASGDWSLDALRATRAELQAIWGCCGYYENRSLSEALLEGGKAFPDAESYYYSDGAVHCVTNRALVAEGLALAGALSELGIGKGDVVAVQLPTWHEAAALYQAIAHVGAIALPIITMYGPSELRFILAQSGAAALFTPAQWRNTDFAGRISSYANLPALRHIVLVRDGGRNGALGWDEFTALSNTSFEPQAVDPNAVALLMYTSGTTSAPKGVQHTHNTLLREWGRPAYANRGMCLSSLPVGHYTGYGYVLRPIIYGAPMVFLDQWDAHRAALLIERHAVRESGGTPVFLLTLLDAARQAGADIGSLKLYSLGGQGMAPSLIATADAAGIAACRVYGLTEHPTVTTCLHDAPLEKRATTDGWIDEGNEVRIIDEHGNDLPAGADGEVLTRGPEMFVGYLDEALDLESFLPGGWFRTGDIGRVDSEGYLTITDRKKDIIIRGGENISSVEVEDVLLAHADILDAAAVAMPDKTYGERVCAFIVVREGALVTLADIRRHFEALGVGRQKVPERLEVVKFLPRNSTGKIKKFELREMANSFTK